MSAVIVVIAAVAIAGFSYSWLSFFVSEERQVKKHLKNLGSYETDEMAEAEPLLIPFRQRVLDPASRAMGRTVHLFAPADYVERAARRLMLAGNPGGMSADRYVAVKVILTVGMGVLFFALGMLGPASFGTVVFVTLLMMLAAFFVPDLWLKTRIDSRKLTIRRSMPDMLDMLTISVEAGMGFDAAVARIVGSRPGPLSEEFGRMLQEVQAGIARRDALRHMSERTQVPELNAFIMAIVQADVFGVSVSSVLRTQSKEMRLKRRQFAEEQAQKAPVKIVFPLVLCILPATLIVIGGPAVVAIARAFGLT